MTKSYEQMLRVTVAEILGTAPDTLKADDNLFEVGLDSLGVLRLVNRLRRDRIEVGFATLAQAPTLAAWSALLEGQSEGPSDLTDDGFTLTEAPADVSTPLGTMQHAYWVGRSPGQRLGGVAAHLYVEFDLKPDIEQSDPALDPDRLRVAFGQLMQRHATLRSKVCADGSQEVLAERSVPFTVQDLRNLPDNERDQALEELRQRLSHQSLDVEEGEVFTAALSLLPGGATRLHLDVDMIAADALSYRLLMSDLVALYLNPNQSLAALRVSYRDYLIGMETQKAARAEAAAKFWRERLPDLSGAPVLPERLLSPQEAQNPCVARRHMWLNPERKADLASMARRNGVTPAMTVATVLAEVIGRWSATDHFLLNVPMFDRPAVHPDIERVAGDFSSSVMLAVDLRGHHSFLEQVEALQAQMHEDAAQAAYGGLDVLRDLSRLRGETVLAPVVFTSALGLGELFEREVIDCVGDPVWIISQGPQVLLDAQVTEFNGGLLINWDTREEALAPGVADAMFAQFEAWLTAVIDHSSTWNAPLISLIGESPIRDLDGTPVRIVDSFGVDSPAHVAGKLEGGAAVSAQTPLWARADEMGNVQVLGPWTLCRQSHGVWVWPQDVEAALRSDPRVTEVAVLPEEEGFNAAVELASDCCDLTGKTIRAELARRVPAHLLPRKVFVLDAILRNGSGEVDSKALQAQLAEQESTDGIVGPRDDLEQLVADVWAEILGLGSVGINEEFIAVGGDSLLATRVVSQLQDVLDTGAITLRALFNHPTVAELVKFLRSEEDAARLDEIAAITMEIRNLSDEEVAELLAAEEAAATGDSRTEPVV